MPFPCAIFRVFACKCSSIRSDTVEWKNPYNRLLKGTERLFAQDRRKRYSVFQALQKDSEKDPFSLSWQGAANIKIKSKKKEEK